MRFVLLICGLYLLLAPVSGFWDDGTSTTGPVRSEDTPRQSFFRWQYTPDDPNNLFFPNMETEWMKQHRRVMVIGGLSIDFTCIGTATILNRRTLITAANLLDAYWNRQTDLRIWLLGRAGAAFTPYRYRVWRVTRLFPKSLNPEHWHGPRGIHSPRHDISIVHSLDQMYVVNDYMSSGMYPIRSHLHYKHKELSGLLWMGGSGYKSLKHIKENFEIFTHTLHKEDIVDCSKYLPKWWGKFICVVNTENFPGIQNGMGFHSVDFSDPNMDFISGIGCFEIRYNEDRIMVFTDLRYYYDWITLYSFIHSGEYYEYAYPQWGFGVENMLNKTNQPTIPEWQLHDDFYPLG